MYLVRSGGARNYVVYDVPLNFLHELSCTRNPNLFTPEYLWQGKISVCKVLLLIKVVSVKNGCFLHPKFELHRYFGFLY